MNPFQTYSTFLALKNHFSNKKYNYFTYNGKVRASLQSFYKRKDRFYFEKMSRQKSDEEIVNFFVANFISHDDPGSLWIGEIIREGEENYKNWQRRTQSMSYLFKQEVSIFDASNFDSMFALESNKHPRLIKEYLQKNVSLETLVILNEILGYKKRFDARLLDPVWEMISLKIEKYTPFLRVDKSKYTDVLKSVVL